MPKGDLYPSHDLAKLILKIGLVYNYRSVIYWFNYRHYWDGYGIITDGHIIWFPSYGSSKFPYNFFTHTFIINLNLYVLQHLLIDCFFFLDILLSSIFTSMFTKMISSMKIVQFSSQSCIYNISSPRIYSLLIKIYEQQMHSYQK